MVISTHSNHFAPDPNILDAMASVNRIDIRLGNLLNSLRGAALVAANNLVTALVEDIDEEFYYVTVDIESAKQALAEAASV